MVVCQSGLMFFSDVVGALREMARVVTPDGTVAVQVWDRLEAQTGYAPLHEEEVYRRIRADAVRALAGFAGEDGRAAVPIAGHLVTARRQGPPAAPARR